MLKSFYGQSNLVKNFMVSVLTKIISVHESMYAVHSFLWVKLCKQMINDLIWQQVINCCIFYATKWVFFGISERCFSRAVKIRQTSFAETKKGGTQYGR